MKNATLLSVSAFALVGLGEVRSQLANVEFTSIVFEGTTLPSAGCAWGDYNNDGFPDLFVANGRWPNRSASSLYRNNRDGTFTKVTPDEAGEIVSLVRSYYMVAWGDYDNDGHLDLFVTEDADAPRPALWRNLGDGRFDDATDVGSFLDDRLWQTPVWGDFNGDGFLDLFVANTWDNLEYPSWASNQLYFNRGDGTFQKVTAGDLARHSATIVEGGAASDLDGDGDLDLFLTGQVATAYFENDGHGNFRKSTTGPHVAGNTIMSAWADYTNDGRIDGVVIAYSGAASPVSRLFQNADNGPWTATSLTTSQAFIAMWADYDNDGDLDLFLSGGDSNIRSQLLANNGDGTFTLVTAGHPVTDLRRSGTCAWADYDNDGFMDLFVTGQGSSPNVLYRNQGNGNRWISVRLVGTASNRAAIGAKVRARATVFGKTTWQLRELGGGNRSQNDLRAHFGLGDATEVEVLRIEWPSGIVQELSNLPANRFLTVTEPPRLRPLTTNGFQIQCWLNQSFDIETSTDLATWTHVTTLTNEDGTLEFHDPDHPDHDCRYYRVVSR